MMSDDKDELIRAQNQVIGILFEVIKRFQSNSDLDEEYFQIITSDSMSSRKDRIDEIIRQRRENSDVAVRLLKQLDV